MRCFLLVLIFLLAGPVWATTYYLDASVASSGDGTSWALAKKTWAEMNTLLDALGDYGAGDTVDVNSGSYGELSGGVLVKVRTDWLTIAAAAGTEPDLTKISLDPGVDRNVYVSFDGFHVFNSTGCVGIHDANYVKILNCNLEITPASVTGYYEPYYALSIVCIGSSDHRPSNVTIQDCNIHNGYRGISGGGPNWLIKDNEIHCLAEDGMSTGYLESSTVEGNYIYDFRRFKTTQNIFGTGISRVGTFTSGEIVRISGSPVITGVFAGNSNEGINVYPTTETTFYNYRLPRLLTACDSGWVSGSGDTVTDSGSYATITLTGNRSAGDKLAYVNLAAPFDVGDYNDAVTFVLRRMNVSLAADSLVLVLSENANGSKTGTYSLSYNLASDANTWTKSLGAYDLTAFNAVQSVGLYANADLPSGAVLGIDSIYTRLSIVGDDSGALIYPTDVDPTHCDCWQIDTSALLPGIVARNNVFDRRRYVGIGSEGGQGVKFVNRTLDNGISVTFENNIVNAGTAFVSGFGVSYKINNNTILGNADFVAGDTEHSSTFLEVYNNIWYKISTQKSQGVPYGHYLTFESHGNNIFCYVPNGFGYIDNNNPSLGSETINGTETLLNNDAAFEALFVNYDINDFNLPSGSLAINFGTASYGPLLDMLGNARDGLPDVGVYEYGGEAPPPGNNAPVLDAIGAKSVLENRLLTFDVNATDADGDPLTYSVGDLPAGISFISPTFTWTPTYRQAGKDTVSFLVTDGENWDTENVDITVTNVPQYLIAR